MYDKEVMDYIYESIGIEGDQSLNEFTVGSLKKIRDITDKLSQAKEELREIRDSDLTEYSDSKTIKKYLDKNSDIIDKVSKEVEKGREGYKKASIKAAIRYLIEFISAYVLVTLPMLGPVGAIVAIRGAIVIIVDCVNYMIKNAKYNEIDNDIQNDLSKLKGVLVKLQNKKGLKDSDKEKISRCINKIEDAQKTTEQMVIRTTQESSWEEIYEQCLVEESYDDPWNGLDESYDPWDDLY